MKILMVGAGGREHALIRKLKESEKVIQVHCAPGNGGISRDAMCHNVAATDIEGMVNLAKTLKIDLVFVAPDDPLSLGMVDAIEAAGIRAFGPNKAAAIIEGSKVFSKTLMKKYNIPTAMYEVFDDIKDAEKYIKENETYPIVIKADGLAFGKGVIIAQDEKEAKDAIKEIMKDKIFGDSGNQIVIEEFLTGPEVTVLSFVDGKTIRPMVSSMDHKPIFDGDKGPNTGGMGAVSPNPYYDDAMAERCMKEIFLPTIQAMNSEGRPFKGCLYFGLMLTADGPKVIEYNARFGDPETQTILPRLKTPLLDIVEAIIDEKLEEIDIQWHDGASCCVILASEGYPGKYEVGKSIYGLNIYGQLKNHTVYHSGTKLKNKQFETAGGRVLGVTAQAETLKDAISAAYDGVKQIGFDGMYYRKDIGNK